MIIELTRISKELTESGEKKLKEYEENQMSLFSGEITKTDNAKDDLGHNAEFYKDLGIDIPEELIDVQVSFPQALDFKDEDYDERETKFLCNTEKVIYFDEHGDDNGRSIIVIDCKVSTIGGVMIIAVKESIETIYKLINDRIK
jgi:hypothetical protein